MSVYLIPEEKNARGVETDRWDDEKFDETAEAMPAIGMVIEELGKITTVAEEQVRDVHALLYQAGALIKDEDQVADNGRVTLAVDKALRADALFPELHDLNLGDPYGAGLTIVSWLPKLAEMHDRLRLQQETAEELKRAREEAEEKHKQAAEALPQDGGLPGEDFVRLKAEAAVLDDLANDLNDNFQRAMEAMELSMAADAAEMVETGVEQARAETALARVAGSTPGELSRTDPETRFRLAETINNPAVKRLADFYGQMENVLAPHMKVRKGIPQRRAGYTRGSNLAHIVADQVALLDDEDLWPYFLAKLANGDLRLHQYEGDEEVGAGGVCSLIDSSGSMTNDFDAFAKAFNLNLFATCKKDKRPFHVVHFDGGTREQVFQGAEDFSVKAALDLATTYLGGGTRYRPALEAGLKFLQGEFARTGKPQSDIVITTDGVPSDLKTDAESRLWITNFMAELDKVGGTCWGVALGNGANSPQLRAICEGKVVALMDLTTPDSTKALKPLFDGLKKERRPKKGTLWSPQT